MLRIAVCDDDKLSTTWVLRLVEQYQQIHPEYDIQAQAFSSASELLESVGKGRHFDLFLLDIIMPGTNGIEAARLLRQYCPDSVLIFMTASDEYALQAFSVKALQYLLKPMEPSALFAAMDDAVALMRNTLSKAFCVSAVGGPVHLPFSTILFVECARRVLHFYLLDGTILRSRTVRTAFSAAVAPLLEDPRFVCPHQSFAVNMTHAVKLTSREFHMRGGHIVPVSRNRINQVRQQYREYLSFGQARPPEPLSCPEK